MSIAVNDMEKRVEQRFKLMATMKVYGIDARGKSFIETVQALNVSPSGVHLAGLKAQNRVGEIIGIQYNGIKVRAGVAWVGYPDSPLDGHIGVHVVGRDTSLWQAVQPAVQGFIPDETFSVSSPPSIISSDRRVARRYACHGSVQLSMRGVGHPVWATVTDLSSTGCYIETPAPVPVTTPVELVLQLEKTTIRAYGEVRGSYPGVGMGVTFSDLKDQDREELNKVLAKLASRQGIAIP